MSDLLNGPFEPRAWNENSNVDFSSNDVHLLYPEEPVWFGNLCKRHGYSQLARICCLYSYARFFKDFQDVPDEFSASATQIIAFLNVFEKFLNEEGVDNTRKNIQTVKFSDVNQEYFCSVGYDKFEMMRQEVDVLKLLGLRVWRLVDEALVHATRRQLK